MRKLLLAAFAASALIPGAASAQSAREVRHDQREINKDIAKGHTEEAIEDQKEMSQDLRAYRRTHLSAYDLPDYVWPNGYTYNALAAGATLANPFWGDQYRVDNYTTYDLPVPGEHRAWVRYGNDVLLIDTRDGRVIVAYKDFFY